MSTVSDSLIYAPRPSAVAAQKSRQSVPCYNLSSAGPGQTIHFNIPCGRRGHYLNTRASYLKFKLKNDGVSGTAADHFKFDFTVSSIISRLELFHGSNLLESIHSYNVLNALWHDIMSGLDEQVNCSTVLEGTSTTKREGVQIDAQADRVFCVQLMSGIIGCMMEKYLPTGALTGGDLRLELTLANANESVVCTNVPKWTMSDITLELEYTELNSEAGRMLEQQNANGYFISFDSFQNYASAVGDNENNMNILIPARFSALKTLFTVARNQTTALDRASKSISQRRNPFLDAGSWYYNIGGRHFPATPIRRSVEAYAELLKSVHALGCVSGVPSLIDYSIWTASNGAFIASADLESMIGKSKLASAGVNTLSINTHLIGDRSGTIDALRLDTFAHYEGILIIQNGIAMVQF